MTRVFEISSGLPVWQAGRILQGIGMQVTRVEPPGGDPVRAMAPESYQTLNGSKHVVTANLKTEEGRSILRKELETADVLLVGIRPSRAEEWRLRPEDLSELELIHVSMTAFGRTGPYSTQAGHDINATAISGTAWVEGGMDSLVGPVEQKTPLADLAAGFFMTIGVLDALIRRDQGERGLISREVSMADASLALLGTWAPELLRAPGQLQTDAFYGIYNSRDGIPLAVGAVEQWQQTLLLELGDVNGSCDKETVDAATLKELFASRDADAWLELAQRQNIAVTPLRRSWEALEDPQISHGLRSSFDSSDPWLGLLYPVRSPVSHDNVEDGPSSSMMVKALWASMES